MLLSRLHHIGWGWRHGLGFHDQHGRSINLLQCPIQELNQRLVQAWQDSVKAVANQRKTMQGIAQASPVHTTSHLQQQPPESQALLRCALNGTFWTADHLKHHSRPEGAAIPSGECPHCGQPDSQEHRHWYCPQFSDCRPCRPQTVPQELPGTWVDA